MNALFKNFQSLKGLFFRTDFGFVISDSAEEKAVQSMLVIKIRTTLK